MRLAYSFGKYGERMDQKAVVMSMRLLGAAK